MAKKKEQARIAPQPVVEQPEDNTPVATPSKVVQLTPIIQPIAFVPYSTQEQPLYMYDDDSAVYDDEFYDYDDNVEEAVAVAPKKQVSIASIFLLIFNILVIGIYVAAKWVLTEYLALVDGKAGLDVILTMIQEQQFTDFTALFATIVPVMCILSIVACLIRIMHKGVCVFAQITSVIALIASLVVIVMALVSSGATLGYGSYAVAAICLVNVLIALLSPKQ